MARTFDKRIEMEEHVEFEDVSDDPIVKNIFSKCLNFAPTIRSKECKCMLPAPYAKHADRIRNLEVRPDDVWVITYPKCGTTWTEEMVWLIANNCDFKKAKEIELGERFIMVELGAFTDSGILGDTISQVENLPSPRFIKSHLLPDTLPTQLFTVKPKIIYTARNPKDVVLSYFNHYRVLNGYSGTQDEFIEAFLQHKVIYGPIWPHLIYFWEKRKEMNMLYLTYEEMKKDLRGVCEKVADFLNVKIPEESKEELLHHLSFDAMKNNESVNFQPLISLLNYPNKKDAQFINKGEAGVWVKMLSNDVVARLNEKAKKAVEGTDFPYYRESL